MCSLASLTGEMAARSFAYHAYGTADSDKSSCYPWFVSRDKTVNQQCILTQARPPMINRIVTDGWLRCVLCIAALKKLMALIRFQSVMHLP